MTDETSREGRRKAPGTKVHHGWAKILGTDLQPSKLELGLGMNAKAQTRSIKGQSTWRVFGEQTRLLKASWGLWGLSLPFRFH